MPFKYSNLDTWCCQQTSNLAMLCSHCSAQALAQAGYNHNCPKRHCSTLATQLIAFSSSSATYFHQQVCFSPTRTQVIPAVPCYTAVELIPQPPAPETPPFLPPLSQPTLSLPGTSLARALTWQLPPQQAKQAKKKCFMGFVLCLPAWESHRELKNWEKKNWPLLLATRSV